MTQFRNRKCMQYFISKLLLHSNTDQLDAGIRFAKTKTIILSDSVYSLVGYYENNVYVTIVIYN